MADFDLKSDEEKAEELKQWWKDNGLSVFLGIALAIGGMFGWQQWKEYKKTRAEGASRLFSQLNDEEKLASNESTEIIKKLETDYDGTPYNTLAALAAAKKYCVSDKLDECISELRKASKSDQAEIADIARLRLARVLIAAKKPDEAKTLLETKMPIAYASLVNEIKGDIYFAKQDIEKAREAYDRAILSAAGQSVEFLKMKRDDLGSSPTTPTTPSKKTSNQDSGKQNSGKIETSTQKAGA